VTRLLVTGATGLLGHVCTLDNVDTAEVYAVVHTRRLDIPGVTPVAVDLRDAARLRGIWTELRPDLVLHTAALASIDACEQQPDAAYELNVEATRTVARLCAEHRSRLVHVSTDAVFDGMSGPYVETDPVGPRSVYARTKEEAERVALDEHPTALVARTNFFGWSASGTRSLAEFFVNAFARGDQVDGFTDVEFSSLYHRDLVGLLLAASDSGLTGLHHVASSDAMSKFEFGQAVARAFGYDESLVVARRISDLDQADTRSARLTLDTDKLAAALGRPPPTFADGLARMRADLHSGYADALRRTGKGE